MAMDARGIIAAAARLWDSARPGPGVQSRSVLAKAAAEQLDTRAGRRHLDRRAGQHLGLSAATLAQPRSKCCVPAPSVLVFNQPGDVVKSWGGPGDNLGYDWPLQEHGILVDSKGSVWLSGNGKGDSMVLKFTTEGKFVKQLGKRGPLTSSTDLTQFGEVAALELDAKANEIYVADGYGNHRVAVLDADTGDIKRIWGAYGKPPTDDNLPAYTPDSPQFANPVHCIGLAKDGLVFVCDRQNNRVQVFHKDGTFVRQYVFDAATKGSGSAWSLSFSP